MSTLSPPLPVKLFVGMLSAEPGLFLVCSEELQSVLGPPDFRSPAVPWVYTSYYAREMGRDLLRQFLFFERTAEPDRLAEIKYLTAAIEQQHAVREGDALHRRINIDPGYITEAKVVLASAKDYSHRISIGRGVYAEVTLRYSKDRHSFVPLEHTYPDFRTDQVQRWFTEARDRLHGFLVQQRMAREPR